MIHIFEQELLPNIKKYDVVLFGMGINNSFNRGLLYDIALNFPKVRKEENSLSPYGCKTKYGTILPIQVEDIIFCPCYMNDGGYCSWNGVKDFVRYEELEKCLKTVSSRFKGKKICAPIIGVSYYDGNGNREKLLNIFEKCFIDCDVDIYDYIQLDRKLDNFRKKNENYQRYKRGEINKEQYEENYRKIMWQIEHGIFEKMPNDYIPNKKDKLIRVKKTDLE